MPQKMNIGSYINQAEGYKAFIPGPFPPSWDIDLSPESQAIFAEATRLLGKLDGITQTLPDLNFFIFMYLRKEAAYSSQIEGTRATMVDAIRAEAMGKKDLPDDVDDILHYTAAMKHGLALLEKLPVSTRLIKEVHRVLLEEGRQNAHAMPGELRTTQNWIGGATLRTAKFIPPPVHEMQSALSDLEKFLNDDTRTMLPLMRAALSHAQFETIHPFVDGNGRTGRLMITFYLCSQQILERPVLYLSAYLKKHRELYFQLLDAYHDNGDVLAWLNFFLEGIIEVATEAIKTCKAVTTQREKDIQKLQSFGRSAEKAHFVLHSLYEVPIITATRIEQLTGLSRTNANKLVKKFVDSGLLVQRGEEDYGRRFEHASYLSLFTQD